MQFWVISQITLEHLRDPVAHLLDPLLIQVGIIVANPIVHMRADEAVKVVNFNLPGLHKVHGTGIVVINIDVGLDWVLIPYGGGGRKNNMRPGLL